MAKNVTPNDLLSIIEDRKLVQEIALDLLNIVRGREAQIADSPVYRRIVMLCAGATFSLWRAVPLVHINREPIDNVLVGANYLEQVVRHNAITYGDDDRSRVWSFGYYLSNARYRIAELCSDAMCIEWPDGRSAIDALGLREKVTSPRGQTYNAGEKIRESIVALRAVVNALKTRLSGTEMPGARQSS
jgi:hypothetical protein